MKKILFLLAMMLPLCVSALTKEETMLKKYFTQPVATKTSQATPGARAAATITTTM